MSSGEATGWEMLSAMEPSIDIHTHGIGGFDTKTASEEDLLRIAKLHGVAGVTQIIPTVYSSSIKTMRENMAVIKKAMELQKMECGRRDADGQKAEAEIIGIHLEGPFLNPLKCGALDPATFLAPDEYNLEKLLEGFKESVKIVTVAPELEGAVKLIRGISGSGIIVSMGHSDASYADAEAGFHAGARGITHIFNAMRGIHHREPGLAGFGLMHKEIYIEVIADPFHLDRKLIELIFSLKNPDRIIIISDTVKDAKTLSGGQGILDGDDTLLGGSMTIRESSKRLILMGMDEGIILKSISENPARYLQPD